MTAHPHFVGPGNSNSGPCVYTVNTLPTEPCAQPLREILLERVGAEREFDAVVTNPT